MSSAETSTPTQIEATEAVRGVIQRYVDAVGVGDTEALGRIVDHDGRMYGFFNGDPLNMPLGQFVEVTKTFTAPQDSGEPYTASITQITVSGTAAVALLQESCYLGADFLDIFVLLNSDGAWKIVNKTFNQLR